MPVSARRYAELRFAISDLIQREDWRSLFELCGTSDDEQSKMIATIFSNYDPRRIWKFVEHISRISSEERKTRRDSLRTVCYILGKMGHCNTRKTLGVLRAFLSDDHMLRSPVSASLSNLWVLDTNTTSKTLLDSWVLRNDENDDLQQVSVRSCEYLASMDLARVSRFLLQVSKLQNRAKLAAKIANEIMSIYAPSSFRKSSPRHKPRKEKHKNKKKKHGKKKRK